jgi:hypothetical protein
LLCDARARSYESVQWLPREEVTLLLGALAALGFLVLGVVDLVWPAGRSRSRPKMKPSAAIRPTPTKVVVRPTRGTVGARLAPTPVAARPAPSPVVAKPSPPPVARPAAAAVVARAAPAPVAARPAPPVAAPTAPAARVADRGPTPVLTNAQRATHALGIGHALLERAERDTTLSADRRLMLVQSAIVWLTRGVQFAPDDAALREALGRAREALWAVYQDIALARLASEMPWGTTALAISRSATAEPGRDERWGAWGAMSGPPISTGRAS